MERGNTKHGARLDEQLKHETDSLTHGAPVESRVEEWREAEPAGEDQPIPDARLVGGRDPGVGNGLSPDEVEARAELARHLRPSAFPANRTVLMSVAREEQAPEAVLDALRQLPDGREYENMQAVWTALGGHVEDHRA